MARKIIALCALALLLAGCAGERGRLGGARPEEVRARIVPLLPPATPDRDGWAADIETAFRTLGVEPGPSELCAVIAVAEQESGLRADPAVPRLGQIARREIDRRAEQAGVPALLVHGALSLSSSDGRSYRERIEAVKTERQLSELFEEFIGMVPLGQRLFAGYNPVHTGGPMQVSIEFAERQAKEKAYPYAVAGSIRHEVFTRRGGLYFGIAHLLDYPAPYTQPLHRFADFNAGRYASRNAAFQAALSTASGLPLELDGDLMPPAASKDDAPGSTERAARSIGARLALSTDEIRRALERGEREDFLRSPLYERVFTLAEQREGRALPRAVLPRIALHSPKITRALTTEWFARRVNERYQRCMARAG